MEFSKKLLILDYIVFTVLIVLAIIFQNCGIDTIAIAWAGQLAISSGFYYWKAKTENRIKVPLLMIKSLDKYIKEHQPNTELDINSYIQAVLDKE